MLPDVVDGLPQQVLGVLVLDEVVARSLFQQIDGRSDVFLPADDYDRHGTVEGADLTEEEVTGHVGQSIVDGYHVRFAVHLLQALFTGSVQVHFILRIHAEVVLQQPSIEGIVFDDENIERIQLYLLFDERKPTRRGNSQGLAAA